jgi:hypothetical protein
MRRGATDDADGRTAAAAGVADARQVAGAFGEPVRAMCS